MARPSLVSLTDSANAPPLNKNGLLHIIWSLSLATAHSEEATELLKTVTSLGAMQHIIHCVETAKPASQPSSPCSPTGLSQNSLGDVVPEAIARALIAESESLREIGCRMLLSFYTSLRVSLSDKVALVGQLPAMRRIVSEMCAACYSPSAHTKRSGCAGIAFIVKELDLGPNWLTDNLIELSKALLFTLKDTHTNALYDNTPISSRETILEIVQKAFPVPVPPLQPEPAPAHAPASKPVPMDTETDDKSVEPEGAGAGGGDDDDGDDKLAEEANDTVKEADKGMVTDTEKLTSDDTAMDVEKPTEDTKMDEDEPKDSEKGDEKGTDSSNKADQPEEAAGSDGDKSTEPAKDSEDEPKKSEGDASVKEEETPKPEPSVSKPKSDTSASRHQTPDASTPKPNTPTATPQQTQQAAQALHAQQAQQTVNTLAARMSLENSRLVMSFLALIIKELANPSAEVRDTVKACMDILVKVTGLSITALLTPCRDRLLVPIFGKPLRALPHNMQIGNIDAITYCMSLEPPFMEINEELMRLLSEALALADAEDQALVNHPAQIRSNTVSLTHLRHVCIRMLTAAMDRPELSQSRHNTTRARIISVFFKSLYHKSIDVVEAANDGLRQVLQQQQKLPKDLLQAGLRPILLNLSDYKRLTVASLDGLARLLQLLTNYFKVEVGRKLLDHMQQWANPQLLQAASSKAIDDLHEIKILVAILQVFHLLPTSANVLLDDLVSSVVNLEVNLCRRESSPFREPLFKFLTRYPNESVLYFMGRIENTHYARIFAHALRSPKCDSLREALVGLTPNIIKVLKSVANAEPKSEDTGAMAVDAAAKDAQPPGQQQSPQTATSAVVPTEATYKRLVVGMHTMTVIHAGLERNPKWIETRPDLLQAMIEVWNAIAAVPTQADQAHRLAKICFLEHYIA
ncbi:transcription-associated protein 1, partial [Linderina macrospora]